PGAIWRRAAGGGDLGYARRVRAVAHGAVSTSAARTGLRGDTAGPLPVRRRAGSAVDPLGRSRDLLEDRRVEGRSFAAHVVDRQSQHPVEAHLAGPSPPVPGAGADVNPVPPPTGLVGGVAVVVLAGEHEGEHVVRVPGHDQDGAILAPPVVLVEGHPSPHDLAPSGLAVT